MVDVDNATLEEPEFCEILTDRLRLRTLRVKDAEKIMPLITCEDVMRWTSQPAVSNLAQGETWLKARALGPDVFNFAIELRRTEANDPADGSIIGLAGSFHLPEIGYMIHPDYTGKGFATEAIQAVIPRLFARIPPAAEGGTGLDHLEGWADIKNLASQRILEKCGFHRCETVDDPENTNRGPSKLIIFRKPRPGMTPEELGLLPSSKMDSNAPTPPVQ